MKWSFLLFSSFLCLQAIAQYPATGNKMRLGWQTTGDGLVYRGAIGDTATLDPSGINNAWMLLDTANGNLYAYRAKAWRLVSGGGGGGGLTMPFDSVTFNVNETDASLRELKYSEEKGYLQYGGQDSVQIPILPGIWYVRNDTSVTIPKGTVLRATGTLGASGRIKVKHMIANGSIDAMYILGIAMQDIAVGADGYAMSQGKIRQVNTQAYSEGAVLYADVDTLGGLTQTEPTGSNLKLPIAFVVHSASNGTLAVRVSPGTYLRDLHDVYITSPVSNASLYYNTSESVWRDTTGAVLTSDTSVFARDFQISGTANRLAMFTGANTVGNGPISRQSDTLNFVNDAGYAAFRMVNTSGGSSSSTFAGWPSGTRYIGRFGGSYEGFSFGDNSGAPQNSAAMQITSWTGSSSNYYSTRLRVNSTGDFGLFLSPIATDANPTYSATPHLMILNGGNVGIATSSPSRPLHVAGTTAIRIPVGNFAQRGTSDNGDIRVRTDTASMEYYSGAWRTVAPMARQPQSGLANRFSKFDANGLLDTSAVLTQSGNNIGVGVTPTERLQVEGTVRATRLSVNTYSSQVLSINNYAPNNSPGVNVFIGDGGQSSTWTTDNEGSGNVSLGFGALRSNTKGSFNFALGQDALYSNLTGNNNIAIGRGAMGSSTQEQSSFALGAYALQYNSSTTGENIAIGYASMQNSVNGIYNVAIGAYSLLVNNGGYQNIVIGRASLLANTTGYQNVAAGYFALGNITTGYSNIAMGQDAGSYFGSSTLNLNQTSNKSIYIGRDARASANGNTNEIVIGDQARGNGSNTTTIGNSSTTKTFFQYGETYIGTATDNGDFALQVGGTGYFSTGLRVDYTAAFDANTIFQMPNTSTKAAKGYAWNTYSDARIKSNFDTIQNALHAIQELKPMYYDQHDSEVIDGKIKLQDGKTRTVGFIAQDVATVIPAAVQAGNDTQLWGMDYTKLIPYLTKAIQEQQAQIEALKKEIEALKNK